VSVGDRATIILTEQIIGLCFGLENLVNTVILWNFGDSGYHEQLTRVDPRLILAHSRASRSMLRLLSTTAQENSSNWAKKYEGVLFMLRIPEAGNYQLIFSGSVLPVEVPGNEVNELRKVRPAQQLIDRLLNTLPAACYNTSDGSAPGTLKTERAHSIVFHPMCRFRISCVRIKPRSPFKTWTQRAVDFKHHG